MGPAWGEMERRQIRRPRAVAPLRKHWGVTKGCLWECAPRSQGAQTQGSLLELRVARDWGASQRRRPSAHLPGLVQPPRLGRRCWSLRGGTASRAGRAGGRAAASGRAGLAGHRGRSRKSRGRRGLSLAGVCLCVGGPTKPLRGEETPAIQLCTTSRFSPQRSKPSWAPAASRPRQAAQPLSALSVPRGSARSERPFPAIRRSCCAEEAAGLPGLLNNPHTCMPGGCRRRRRRRAGGPGL